MSIPKPPLAKLEKTLGYQFQARDRFERALRHRSASHDHNERLEFLGDSILGFVIAEQLCRQFPNVDEGDLSRMRATIVCGKSLAKLAKRFEVGSFLELGPGEMKSGGHRRDSILADAMEALIGAIYLETGMNGCRTLILTWFTDILATIQPGQAQKDAKTRLQEYLQGRSLALPNYDVVSTSGQAHNQMFTVSCTVELLTEAVTAQASSRRKAEQQAAAIVVEKLKELTGHDL